jgi:GNAT superfamily N-acetyltransferase
MIEIREVKTRADLRRFVRFPHHLYRNNPNYIPVLDSDEIGQFNVKQNPALKFCETACYMAWRDGQPVGRVAVIENKAFNQVTCKRYLRFSRLDFIDDEAVLAALMATVETEATRRGLDLVHGPMGFCDLDREGMLIEGFDQPGLYVTYYNEPYYPELLTRLGYEKDVDYVELDLYTPKTVQEVERVFRISDYVMKKLGLSLVPLRRMSDTKPYIAGVFDLINRAYQHLYGYVQITDELRDTFVKQFFSLIRPEFVKVVVDDTGEVVAVAIAAPNISRACRKANGRLFPFGFLYLLRDLRQVKALDLYLIAVKPELQSKGVNAILLTEMIRSAMALGVPLAHATPELEHNTKVQDQWKNFDARYTKKRRIFCKAL